MYSHADEKKTRERSPCKPPPPVFPAPHQKLDKSICNRLDEFHRHHPKVFSKSFITPFPQAFPFPRVLICLSEGKKQGSFQEGIQCNCLIYKSISLLRFLGSDVFPKSSLDRQRISANYCHWTAGRSFIRGIFHHREKHPIRQKTRKPTARSMSIGSFFF